MKNPLIILFCIIVCSACHHTSKRPENPNLFILSINDVYQTSGTNNGKNGGLARVKTLRDRLLKEGKHVLLLHAGDFLHPSFDSRIDGGQAMIQALNLLDGDAQQFDPDMLVTFGNHEFDKGKLKHSPLLQNNLDISQFDWLDSNISWNQQHISSDKLKKYIIKEYNDIKVGLYSVTTDMVQPEYIESFQHFTDTSQALVPMLREQGVDVVIALTHHWMQSDRAMLEMEPAYRPDLIIGGHEHDAQIVTHNGRWIIKADADANSAAATEVSLASDGQISVFPVLYPLDERTPKDAAMTTVIQQNQRQNEITFCREKGLDDQCLSQVLGHTQVKLIAEETEIRRFETNLGNYLADTALAAFSQCGAQIAMLNSGSLRLNENIAANSDITQKHLEGLFPYPSQLQLIQINGSILRQMLNHSIDYWTANGHWLQIAGFAFVHDPEQQRVEHIHLAGDSNVLHDDQLIKAVVPEYLIAPYADQDGYVMINETMSIECESNEIGRASCRERVYAPV